MPLSANQITLLNSENPLRTMARQFTGTGVAFIGGAFLFEVLRRTTDLAHAPKFAHNFENILCFTVVISLIWGYNPKVSKWQIIPFALLGAFWSSVTDYARQLVPFFGAENVVIALAGVFLLLAVGFWLLMPRERDALELIANA